MTYSPCVEIVLASVEPFVSLEQQWFAEFKRRVEDEIERILGRV